MLSVLLGALFGGLTVNVLHSKAVQDDRTLKSTRNVLLGILIGVLIAGIIDILSGETRLTAFSLVGPFAGLFGGLALNYARTGCVSDNDTYKSGRNTLLGLVFGALFGLIGGVFVEGLVLRTVSRIVYRADRWACRLAFRQHHRQTGGIKNLRKRRNAQICQERSMAGLVVGLFGDVNWRGVFKVYRPVIRRAE